MNCFNFDISDYVRAHPYPPPVRRAESHKDTASMIVEWTGSLRFLLFVGMVWLFSKRKARRLLEDAAILQASIIGRNLFFPKDLQNRISRIVRTRLNKL